MGIFGLVSVLSIVTAIITILIAAVCIHTYHVPAPSLQETRRLEGRLAWSNYNDVSVIFTTFGTLFLAFNGYMLALPNIAVLMMNKEMLAKTILVSIIVLAFFYLIAGLIPYFLLKDYVINSSVMVTIARITGSSENTSFGIFIKIIELLVVLHFLIVVLLAMNPVYLMTEAYFNLPRGEMTTSPAGTWRQNDVVRKLKRLQNVKTTL